MDLRTLRFTEFTALTAVFLMSVCHGQESGSSTLPFCGSWNGNFTSAGLQKVHRIQLEGYPEPSRQEADMCYLTLMPSEEMHLIIQTSLLREDGRLGCSPLMAMKAEGSVGAFYTCASSQPSKTVLHLMPGQPLEIGLLNPDGESYTASITLSGLSAGILSIESWDVNPLAGAILSKLPKPELYSIGAGEQKQDSDRGGGRVDRGAVAGAIVAGSICIIVILAAIIGAWIKYRVCNKEQQSPKKSSFPFSDNPAFSATPVPSIYDPSMHSNASLASTSTAATADQGWGIIMKAGVIGGAGGGMKNGSSRDLNGTGLNGTGTGENGGKLDSASIHHHHQHQQKNPLPLATISPYALQQNASSHFPFRDDVDPDITEDPRSPGWDDPAAGHNPQGKGSRSQSPFRQHAEPRADSPTMHPYFDPRSPVSMDEVPGSVAPGSMAHGLAPGLAPGLAGDMDTERRGSNPFIQHAKPREDEPTLNPYFDPRSPVTTDREFAPIEGRNTPDRRLSNPYVQHAKPRDDELHLNPYFDPRSPITMDPDKAPIEGHLTPERRRSNPYLQHAEPRPDSPNLNPYFDPRSPITSDPDIAPTFPKQSTENVSRPHTLPLHASPIAGGTKPKVERSQIISYTDPRSPTDLTTTKKPWDQGSNPSDRQSAQSKPSSKPSVNSNTPSKPQTTYPSENPTSQAVSTVHIPAVRPKVPKTNPQYQPSYPQQNPQTMPHVTSNPNQQSRFQPPKSNPMNPKTHPMNPQTIPMNPKTNPMNPKTNPMNQKTNPLNPKTNPINPITNKPMQYYPNAPMFNPELASLSSLESEAYFTAQEELPDPPMSPIRKAIPASPYRPVSRSSGDYGAESYNSLQIARPSGGEETEL